MRNIRLTAVAAFTFLMVLAVVGPGEGHVLPTLRFPDGIVQGNTLSYVEMDQFHLEDHAAMMNDDWTDWDRADTAALVAALGLPPELVRIVACESLHDPSAVGKTDDWGLFQIHGRWVDEWGLPRHIAATRGELLNPYRNGLAAAYIYGIQGLDAWVCWDIIRGR